MGEGSEVERKFEQQAQQQAPAPALPPATPTTPVPAPAYPPYQPLATPPAAPAAPLPREPSPEEREFMETLTRLFSAAQEFGLTLASIDTKQMRLPQEIEELIEQGREVAKAVKDFQRLIRRRTRL
jgi:hypothetical protein